MKVVLIRMGLGVLCLLTVPVAEASGQSACGKATSKALYTATFQWQSSKAWRKIIVAKALKPRFNDSKIVAKLMNGSSCEAICDVQRIDTVGTGNSMQVASMEMTCQSAQFGALSSPATLWLRDDMTGRPATILRFGTWLQGYKQTMLTTEVDRSDRLAREIRKNNAVKLASRKGNPQG